MDIITATKIKNAIADYERDNAAEFAVYQQQKKAITELMANEFAAVKGDHVMQRQLFNIPETLFNKLKLTLTPDEFAYIWGSDPNCVGAKWFAKTFRQYRTGSRF